jgi:CheY-like chemotaxis protein
MKRPSAVVVAVWNTSRDVVEMMRRTLEQAGFVVVTALTHELRDGLVNVEAFIRQHDPRVIVYDIAPPYDANWRLFEHLRARPFMRHRQFVLTSVNAAQVEKVATKSTPRIHEIVGKPLDLMELVRAVKEAARARPVRRS